MDQPHVEEAELAVDLRNLGWINALLGGIAVIRAHLPREMTRGAQAVGSSPARASNRESFEQEQEQEAGSGGFHPATPPTCLDVASGGGDIPRWLIRHGPPLTLIAADLHPQMLQLARTWSAGLPIRFLRCDARQLPFRDRSVDLVLCSLMLHHLTEADALTALRELARITRRRLIVNDLRRSRVAYVLIWLITRFSRNRLTRYDSPVSVERAFTPAELEALARAAGLDRQGSFRVSRHLYYRMALVFDPVTATAPAAPLRLLPDRSAAGSSPGSGR
jgi:2-polyprenyl-3-methyl-5-hydroxy-6-metoxy-1,4-benzoquinol methylase